MVIYVPIGDCGLFCRAGLHHTDIFGKFTKYELRLPKRQLFVLFAVFKCLIHKRISEKSENRTKAPTKSVYGAISELAGCLCVLY